MNIRPTLIVIILIICVLAAGCTSLFPVRAPKGPAELTDPSWRMVSYYNDNGSMAMVGPLTNITLKFGEEGNVSGFVDGCRIYSGRYTTIGETINVTNITEVSESACTLSEETSVMETAYFSLLQKSPRFNINEGTFVFGYYDAQRYLVFTRT